MSKPTSSLGGRPRFLGLTLLLYWLVMGTAASAELLHCPEVDAVVHYGNRQDATTACAAAEDSLAFMATHGFVIDRPLLIRVVEPVTWIECRCAFGRFDATENRVEVLPYASCQHLASNTGVFGIPLTRELYRSFFAHEIAHAVAHWNFRVPSPGVAAHEYIAYTTQLATMTPRLRSEILARFDVAAFTCDQEISEVYLALSPEQFAVNAYQHFQQPGNGRAFFPSLADGKALVQFSCVIKSFFIKQLLLKDAHFRHHETCPDSRRSGTMTGFSPYSDD